jgi:hypothetical protein
MQSEIFEIDPSRLAHGRYNYDKDRDEGEGDISGSYSGDTIAQNGRVRKPFNVISVVVRSRRNNPSRQFACGSLSRRIDEQCGPGALQPHRSDPARRWPTSQSASGGALHRR